MNENKMVILDAELKTQLLGNWQWRIEHSEINEKDLAIRIQEIISKYSVLNAITKLRQIETNICNKLLVYAAIEQLESIITRTSLPSKEVRKQKIKSILRLRIDSDLIQKKLDMDDDNLLDRYFDDFSDILTDSEIANKIANYSLKSRYLF